MKIFMVTASDLSVSHGPTVHFMKLAQHLQQKGIKVTVFAPRLGRYPFETTLPIHYIPTLPIRKIALFFYQFPLFFWLVYNYLVHRPNIIYTRTSFFTWAACLVAHMSKVPHIAHVIGLQIENAKRAGRNRILKGIVGCIESFNIRYSHMLVTQSPGLKRKICTCYKKSDRAVTIIEPGTDTELFHPMPILVAQTRIDLEETHPMVGYIGTLDQWQNVDILLQAMPIIHKDVPETRCLILGTGTCERTLRDLATQLAISDKVLFVGKKPHTEVPHFINACNVCVIPRYMYPHRPSIKLFEYMACGQPVVATDIPVFSILRTYEAGLLAQPNSADSLAHNIVQLLRNQSLARHCGDNGRHAVSELHTWTNTAQEFVELFQRITTPETQL